MSRLSIVAIAGLSFVTCAGLVPIALSAEGTVQTTGDDIIRLEPEPVFDADLAVDRASNALNQITSARGRFVQFSQGSTAEGDFALRRPGRLRFDYDDPTPLLIVSNGTTVAIEDSELETVDRVPLSATPLGLILKRTTNLANDARILSVRNPEGSVVIELEDKTGEADGSIALYFDEDNFDLLQWEITDAQGQRTTVALQNVETNVKLNGRLFRIDEDEDDDFRR